MKQQWVVWIRDGRNGWWPSSAMSQDSATRVAEQMKQDGVVFSVRPAHSITRADVVNG